MELKGLGILFIIALAWFILKPLFIGIIKGIIALFSGKTDDASQNSSSK